MAWWKRRHHHSATGMEVNQNHTVYNGRLANFLHILMQPAGRTAESVLLGLCIGALFLLLCKCIRSFSGPLTVPGIIAATLSFWIILPWHDTFQSLDFQCNYVLPSLVVVLLILLFHKSSDTSTGRKYDIPIGCFVLLASRGIWMCRFCIFPYNSTISNSKSFTKIQLLYCNRHCCRNNGKPGMRNSQPHLKLRRFRQFYCSDISAVGLGFMAFRTECHSNRPCTPLQKEPLP